MAPFMSAQFTLTPGASPCLSLEGDWTLENYDRLMRDTPPVQEAITALDASKLTDLDTAGATVLLTLLGADKLGELTPSATGLSEERKALLIAVAKAMTAQEHKPEGPGWRFGDGLANLGRTARNGSQQILQFLDFLGLTLVTIVTLLPRPQRWRFTALIAQMHQTGLNAVPIVVLLNFLVGAVVAFLGATVLSDFGAAIYTVDLVGYAFMREMGALLAAILLAGRTASAFTAQIGSMKINEELDAIKVLGLDPIELLVLPRMVALLIVLPLLTFLAIIAGIVGGAVVAVATLDISVARFIGIIQEIPLKHLILGMVKAPVFAVMIALIGCLEGFKVGGSAQSVGDHTTSAVVQSIFVVILLNAIFALFFMEMGW